MVVWIVQEDVAAETPGSGALTGCDSLAAPWIALNTSEEERNIFFGGRTKTFFFLELSIFNLENFNLEKCLYISIGLHGGTGSKHEPESVGMGIVT